MQEYKYKTIESESKYNTVKRLVNDCASERIRYFRRSSTQYNTVNRLVRESVFTKIKNVCMSDKSLEPDHTLTLSHSHSLTLSLSHSLALSLSHSLTFDMLNNFCFHVYAQKSVFIDHPPHHQQPVSLDVIELVPS